MTTKFHLSMTDDGHIAEGLLSGDNVVDITEANDLTEDVYVCYVVEDKSYDGDEHRENLISRHNIPVIPGRKNIKVKIIYDKIKENKRIAMRFDKSDESFLGFLAMASIKILLKLKII